MKKRIVLTGDFIEPCTEIFDNGEPLVYTSDVHADRFGSGPPPERHPIAEKYARYMRDGEEV